MADLELYDTTNGPEFWWLGFVIIGTSVALALKTSPMIYVAAVILGAFAGRKIWYYKHDVKGALLFAFLGLPIGLMLGAYAADRKILMILFVLGIIITYYCHDKEIIWSTEY